MKKFIFLGAFWFIMCGAVSAQSPLTELDKIKQIKFLESTREDVRRIFAGYKESNARVDASNFETKFLRFNIFYSTGNCAAEDEDWNMPEGKVTSIMIFFKKSFKPEDLAVDLSSLRKEKTFTDSSEDFIYHDKNIGVSYSTCNGEIHSMNIFPPKNNYPFVCNKQTIKKFYQNNRWSDEKTKKPNVRYFADVTKLTLSSNEVIAGCDSDNSTDGKSCADSVKLIDVLVDAEASPCTSWDFTYNYTITGGKIIGQGEKVIWDLSGVKPGRYTITAGVDNGCGVCGTTRTKEVVVKECSDCKQK